MEMVMNCCIGSLIGMLSVQIADFFKLRAEILEELDQD